MKLLMTALLAAATLGAQSPQTFTGTVSDDMCANSHAAMQMGPTDAECAIACHEEHDAAFVLVVDAKTVYKLSDQAAPRAFAGKVVKVVGRLDEKTGTISVESIAAR